MMSCVYCPAAYTGTRSAAVNSGWVVRDDGTAYCPACAVSPAPAYDGPPTELPPDACPEQDPAFEAAARLAQDTARQDGTPTVQDASLRVLAVVQAVGELATEVDQRTVTPRVVVHKAVTAILAALTAQAATSPYPPYVGVGLNLGAGSRVDTTAARMHLSTITAQLGDVAASASRDIHHGAPTARTYVGEDTRDRLAMVAWHAVLIVSAMGVDPADAIHTRLDTSHASA